MTNLRVAATLALFTLPALGLALGCNSGASKATQVLVLIDAQSSARNATTVRVRVLGGASGSGALTLRKVVDLDVDHGWPVDMVVEPKDGDASRSWKVEAWALRGDAVLGAATAQGGFRQGALLTQRIVLEPGLDLGSVPGVPDDAGVQDGGGSAGTGMAGGGSTNGACHANPDPEAACPMICPERCNAVDDDCDQRIDEDDGTLDCSAAHAQGACDQGACVIQTCVDGYRDCDGLTQNGCEIAPDDPDNCGACGHACSVEHGTAGCANGACTRVGCQQGFIDCDGDPLTCETPSNTLTNCGACNAACTSVPNASPSCATSSCGVDTCNDGYGDCDDNGKNGCEKLLDTVDNCGACGKVCSFPGTQAACSKLAQVCTSTGCDVGFDDCDANPLNGCESLTSADNCGGCGQACSTTALARTSSAECTDGACAVTCKSGFGDCDGNPLNGCEVATDTLSHCGGCASCPALAHATPACTSSQCAISGCNQGYGDCNHKTSDGCETALDTLGNCGGCNVSCSKLSCAGGVCTAIDCPAAMPGYADCNGDGLSCETNIAGDINNCGVCGLKCAFDAAVTAPHATLSCANKACTPTCEAGYGDCDHDYRNGCEAPLNTLTNCGSCGTGCAIAKATATCATGTCQVASCNTDYADCDQNKTDCEIALNSANHCGGCTTVCTLPNATPGCGGSPGARVCTVASCTQTYFKNCNGSAGDGCEVDARSDTSNCGACGNDCAALPNVNSVSCANSACSIASCADGYADCSAAQAGCETNLHTLQSCGACGVPCSRTNATPTCGSGSCAISSCNSGFGDCDHVDSTGCETPLGTRANCSTCGDACSGYCKSGTCAACTSGADCDDGNPCTADSCNGGVCSWAPATAGTVCRAAAGACDVAETCDGVGTTCPADVLVAAGNTCRASTGACDLAETCTGSAVACPADNHYAPNTTQCYASQGPCDNGNVFCTGASNACPAPSYKAATTVCRSSSGPCDLAETCTGASGACPSDTHYASNTTVCRAAVAGGCDLAELCTGASNSCPSDQVVTPGTVCRASTGACDLAESCDGSNACPANNHFASSSTQCYASSGPCDNGDVFCSGASNTCPAVTYKSSSTTCRPVAGVCDVAEKCTGSAAACPADGKVMAGTLCRGAAGVCDVAEYCDGVSVACAVDGFAPIASPCTDDDNVCSVDACDGAGACTHAAGNAGAVCRAAATACDSAELCDGTSTICPSDVVAANGTRCYASPSMCDDGDLYCDGGTTVCPSSTFVQCPNVDPQCHDRSSCNPAVGACPPAAKKADGTPCDDGDASTTADKCSNGTCVGVPPCTDNTQCAATEYCSSGACTTKITTGSATTCTADSQCASAKCDLGGTGKCVACGSHSSCNADAASCTIDTCTGFTAPNSPNVDASTWTDYASAPVWSCTASGTTTVNSTTGMVTSTSCALTSGYTLNTAITLATSTNNVVQTDQTGSPPNVMVVRLKGLTVSGGHVLKLTGNKPIVFLIAGDVVVNTSGKIDASAAGTTAGPGGSVASECTGQSGGNGSVNGDGGGGGGGGFGTAGGKGGSGSNTSSTAGSAGSASTDADLVPLRGGCPGGSGGDATRGSTLKGFGGGGGGAFEITASGAITIGTGSNAALLSAAGGYGQGNDDNNDCTGDGGGGGGSGGAILLVSPALASFGTSAVTRVHGGAGGGGSECGSSGNGEDGHTTDDTAAAGGSNDTFAGRGGNGGLCKGIGCATTSAVGAAGSSAFGGAGGGGGGGGRVVVATRAILQYNACAQTNAVTSCASDSNPCSIDQCSGGTCTHAAGNAGALCGKSGDFCINDALCTGSSTTCPAPTNKPDLAACDDNNPRTSDDACNAGLCRGT